MTRADHASGTDRLAEAATQLELTDDEIVVNVQGDEPLIAPRADRAGGRDCWTSKKDAERVHRLPRDPRRGLARQSERGQGRARPRGLRAVFLALADSVSRARRAAACYRHAGIYGYRVGFLQEFSACKPRPLEKAEALEQLRVLWHGYRIAVAVSETEIPPGVDTPQDLEAVRRMLS